MPDPIVLGFDTSAAHCAGAILIGTKIKAQRHEVMAKGQAEHLFPMLEALLSEAGLGWKDLTAIGVGVGPGNFTGIRCAVAAARGLALSLDIPATGVSITEAVAYGQARPCRVIVAAKRDYVFWQDFDHDHLTRAGAPQQCLLRDLPDGPEVVTALYPLAESIARITAESPAPRKPPAPIYLRPADAAPPREAALLILT